MKLGNKMIKQGGFVLGADPEFFYLRDDDVAINADRFLPSKKKPMEFSLGCKLFFDGFQGELNIPSAYCREALINSTRKCLRKARAEAGKRSRGKSKYRIAPIPATPVLPDILAKADEEARIFGCDPDFDAYAGGSNPPGPDAETHYMRYSGGHIHLGHGNETRRGVPFMYNETGKRALIKLTDIVAGIPMVLLDRHTGNAARRELYGRAGCYRSPKYGIEWRVPSNFWLKAPELASFMFGMVRLAANIMYSKKEDYFFNIVDQDAVRYAIDMNDFDVAKELYSVLKHNLLAAGSDIGYGTPLNAAQRRWTGGKWFDIPGVALFEYLVYKGVEGEYDDLDYAWNLGMTRNKDSRGHVNGWFSGWGAKVVREHIKEFNEFQKGARNHDVVNF